MMGVSLPATVVAAATFGFSMTANFDITYRGLRADTTAISENPSAPQ